MEPKVEVGKTLAEVFEIYREHAGVLLPVAFWLFLASSIVAALLGEDLALFPIVFVVETLVSSLYIGMVVALVKDAKGGRREFSIRELAGSILPMLLPLAAVGIIYGLGTVIGLVLLVVPGLALMTIWAVASPAVVIERASVFAALRRSNELVSGQGWRVFGVIAISSLITAAALLIFIAIAAAVLDDGPIVLVVFSALAATLTAPIEALVAAVLYFRLRELKGPPDSDSVLQQAGHG